MKDKVWIRNQFLNAIDNRIEELRIHCVEVGVDFPEHDTLVNQRNRVAVFLGESKHRYSIRRA